MVSLLMPREVMGKQAAYLMQPADVISDAARGGRGFEDCPILTIVPCEIVHKLSFS